MNVSYFYEKNFGVVGTNHETYTEFNLIFPVIWICIVQ